MPRREPERRHSPRKRTTSVEAAQLKRLEELFHGLIRSRAREFALTPPRRLPSLRDVGVAETEARWFPVPGMYGGFAFRLEASGDGVDLIAESWSRVVTGSGMRHRCSATQVVLEAEGFV